jgi:hypothetical protein
MSLFESIMEGMCELCDRDPATCYNAGYCAYEEECEDESLE